MQRSTRQYLMPAEKQAGPKTAYDPFPSFPLVSGTIHLGYDGLAERIAQEKTVMLDGYIGVDWMEVVASLTDRLRAKGPIDTAHPHTRLFKERSRDRSTHGSLFKGRGLYFWL